MSRQDMDLLKQYKVPTDMILVSRWDQCCRRRPARCAALGVLRVLTCHSRWEGQGGSGARTCTAFRTRAPPSSTCESRSSPCLFGRAGVHPAPEPRLHFQPL